MKTHVLFFAFFTFLMISCSGTKKKLTSLEIIKKSINKHGGLKAWEKVKQLDFDKKTILFTKEGKVEKIVEQHQTFKFIPNLKGKIVSNEGVGTLFNGVEFLNIIKDTIVGFKNKSALIKAINQFYAAEYVVCQPFKLNDKNIILTDKGIEEINKTKAYAIGVTYKKDTNTSDRWIYYFDVSNFQLIATKVIHLERDSLIENISFDTTSGFIFNSHRKSFITDVGSKKTYLRAEYFYTNYKVLF